MRAAKGSRIVVYERRSSAPGGLIDADLGGGIIKQRVARSGQGRSGGYRMLVAYRTGDTRRVPLRVRQERAGEHRCRRVADAAGDRGGMACRGREAHCAGHRRGILQEVTNDEDESNLAGSQRRCLRPPTTCVAPG